MAQEGFEPSASLVLSENGLPVAYRANFRRHSAFIGSPGSRRSVCRAVQLIDAEGGEEVRAVSRILGRCHAEIDENACRVLFSLASMRIERTPPAIPGITRLAVHTVGDSNTIHGPRLGDGARAATQADHKIAAEGDSPTPFFLQSRPAR
jgi:hypothetical protein